MRTCQKRPACLEKETCTTAKETYYCTLSAFAQWRSMRSDNVSTPLMVRKALNGAMHGPRSRRPTACA